MATNIKIIKIVKNSKMKRFQWKWIFTGSKTCCTILQPFRFVMVAILNPKLPPKSSDLGEIWYYYRHDRVKNWALIISCYVLTLFFIHTTSTCIVRSGDICSTLRYSNQYFVYRGLVCYAAAGHVLSVETQCFLPILQWA